MAPRSFSRSTAATAVLPVASTGATTIDQTLAEIGRRLEVIFDGGEGLRLAIEPDMGDARRRDEIEHAFGESEAGAQDRREDQFLPGEARRHHRGERRLDLDFGQRQVARDLVAEQHADFVEQLAKRFGRAGLVADERQLVLHQRMIDDL